jgi:hypothetical protein
MENPGPHILRLKEAYDEFKEKEGHDPDGLEMVVLLAQVCDKLRWEDECRQFAEKACPK